MIHLNNICYNYYNLKAQRHKTGLAPSVCFSWDWRQRSFSVTAILAWPYKKKRKKKKTCDDNNFGLKNLVCSSVSGLCCVTWKCHTTHKESDTRNWTNPRTQQVPRAKFTLFACYIQQWSMQSKSFLRQIFFERALLFE